MIRTAPCKNRPQCKYIFGIDPAISMRYGLSRCDDCPDYIEATFLDLEKLHPVEDDFLSIPVPYKNISQNPKFIFRSYGEDAFQQLQREVIGWRRKHAEMMLELDRLKKHSKPTGYLYE